MQKPTQNSLSIKLWISFPKSCEPFKKLWNWFMFSMGNLSNEIENWNFGKFIYCEQFYNLSIEKNSNKIASDLEAGKNNLSIKSLILQKVVTRSKNKLNWNSLMETRDIIMKETLKRNIQLEHARCRCKGFFFFFRLSGYILAAKSQHKLWFSCQRYWTVAFALTRSCWVFCWKL